MKFGSVLKRIHAVPSLILVGLLVSGCATAPVSPPAPITTGQPRPDPTPTPEPMPDIEEPIIEEPDEPEEVDLSQYYLTPEFMQGRDIKRVAVLLPFSHRSSAVRAEANGLLAAVEMALFDHGTQDILLLPKDTAGEARVAASATQEAILQGADVIIGPLFANNVTSVANSARDSGIPVLAFSNDRSAAGGGAYLVSFPPEEEVARIVDWASLQGINRFAFIGPSSVYSRRVETALRFEASRRGGVLIGSEFYRYNGQDDEPPVDEAQRIANRVKSALSNGPGKVAIVIPDNGTPLRAVAPLIPYYGADLRRLQYIGTSEWDDPEIWREPVMKGATYATPDPQASRYFRNQFERTYNREPAALSSLGYDATSLAISFLDDGMVTDEELGELDGFRGLNGLFRFRSDGTVERGLAVMEIQPSGPKLIEEAPTSFSLGGS
ncbi:MAG: penicillin-binding protein activator [Ponticaulis sp.]|nr:penicillin-binding protein activator [Ponticaulis sp.]|tara:strand:- start:72710 stop:74023 length:1314 start_codon:yes stop_codon:yes gene_type:complete